MALSHCAGQRAVPGERCALKSRAGYLDERDHGPPGRPPRPHPPRGQPRDFKRHDDGGAGLSRGRTPARGRGPAPAHRLARAPRRGLLPALSAARRQAGQPMARAPCCRGQSAVLDDRRALKPRTGRVAARGNERTRRFARYRPVRPRGDPHGARPYQGRDAGAPHVRPPLRARKGDVAGPAGRQARRPLRPHLSRRRVRR